MKDKFRCDGQIQDQVERISSHLQSHVGSQLQKRRPIFGRSIEGGLCQQQRYGSMTQTGFQSHLDHLSGDQTLSTGNRSDLLIIKFENEVFFSEAEMSYLDLCCKVLALVVSVLLSEALRDFRGLVHSQEPVVTAINVHDRPEVTGVRLHLLILLLMLLCCHGSCYRHHCVEDER